MEVKTLKMKGHQVASIFTGKHYYFVSSYYGLIAIADRVEYNRDACLSTKFVIRVGNERLLGSHLESTVPVGFVKRFIKLQERQYVEDKKVEFEVVNENLDKLYIDIVEKEY